MVALIVEVKINQSTIIRTVACRIRGNHGEPCVYEVDGGGTIKHHYDDGAEALAIKLLKRLMRSQPNRKGA